MKKRVSGEMEFLAQVRQLLLEAGYLSVVDVPRNQNTGCDLIAYAPGPKGAAMGSAVDVKFGEKINMDLEAANLDLARTRAGVESGLLLTASGIFDLSKHGTKFMKVDAIPRVIPTQDPITSQKAIATLFWEIANGLRSSSPNGRVIEDLIGLVEAKDGVVALPSTPIQIDGSAFRQFLSSRSFPVKSATTESMSSQEIQSAFASLAELFPDTTSIFDPFFGAGLSTFAAMDALKQNSKVERVFGFEVNPLAIELAQKFSKTVGGLKKFELQANSALDCDWPEADLLLTEPPMGLRLNSPLSIGSVVVKSVETFTVLKAALEVHEGKDRKAAVILTSRSWLLRESDQSVRDKLLELGVVRAVLGLPSLKLNTSIPLAVIVLAKGDSQLVIGELLDDWEDQLNGEVGDLRELLKF